MEIKNDNKVEKSSGNKKQKTHRLFDIDIDEISLVDKAAVSADGFPEGRNFILFKRLTDPELPKDLSEPFTEEQMEAINKEWESMGDEEKLACLKELDWLLTVEKINTLEQKLEEIKKQDSFLYAEISFHPERFDVDEETMEITRKVDAPKPKPEKIWDEVAGRWITKNVKGWKECKDGFGRRFWKKEQGGNQSW